MKYSRATHHLYTASLFFLIFLTGVCVAISAVDVIIQAFSDRTEIGRFNYTSVIVVAACYFVLAIVSLSLACCRLINVRRSLKSISKSHIPTGYIPKRVLLRVQDGFQTVKYIRQVAEPLPDDVRQLGWAKPGTKTFEGVDFKCAIARTPAIIEKAAIEINESYARPPYVPIRHYIEFLMQEGLMDVSFGKTYIEGYERARFSQYAPVESEYLDIMKHLAAILNQMGYHLHQAATPTPSLYDKSSSNNSNNNNSNNNNNGSSTSEHSKKSNFSNKQRSQRTSPFEFVHRSSERSQLNGQPSRVDDSDVASLAQSVATWSSKSVRRYPHTSSSFYDNNSDMTDEDDYSDNMRHIIYDRLMQTQSY
ncbi:hypothetical protein BJ944DRAFT_259327 [Cunninghamella echinulata]|nr:hypothetical protein BJ944DRAFT_259327 [Cunninghamella echinulata]